MAAEVDPLALIGYAREQMRGAVLASRDGEEDRRAGRQAIGHAREALAMIESLARGMRPEPPRQTRAEAVPREPDEGDLFDRIRSAFGGPRVMWQDELDRQAEVIRQRQQRRKEARERVR